MRSTRSGSGWSPVQRSSPWRALEERFGHPSGSTIAARANSHYFPALPDGTAVPGDVPVEIGHNVDRLGEDHPQRLGGHVLSSHESSSE